MGSEETESLLSKSVSKQRIIVNYNWLYVSYFLSAIKKTLRI